MNQSKFHSNSSPKIINDVVYNMLHMYVKMLPKNHTTVILAFDDFPTKSINMNMVATCGDIEPPQRCIIFQLIFVSVYDERKTQILGNVTYFNETARQKVATAIHLYIEDLYSIGLTVVGTMSSGNAYMKEILQKFDWEDHEAGKLIHSVGKYKGIVHIFDPSWLMCNLLETFKSHDISFKMGGVQKTASFNDICSALNNSETNDSLKYKIKNKISTVIASKVFSTTMANLLSLDPTNDQLTGNDTSDFCKFFDTLHDSLNGTKEINLEKPFPQILTCNSLHHPFFIYALCILSSIKIEYKNVTNAYDELILQQAIHMKKLELIKSLKQTTEIEKKKQKQKLTKRNKKKSALTKTNEIVEDDLSTYNCCLQVFENKISELTSILNCDENLKPEKSQPNDIEIILGECNTYTKVDKTSPEFNNVTEIMINIDTKSSNIDESKENVFYEDDDYVNISDNVENIICMLDRDFLESCDNLNNTINKTEVEPMDFEEEDTNEENNVDNNNQIKEDERTLQLNFDLNTSLTDNEINKYGKIIHNNKISRHKRRKLKFSQKRFKKAIIFENTNNNENTSENFPSIITCTDTTKLNSAKSENNLKNDTRFTSCDKLIDKTNTYITEFIENINSTNEIDTCPEVQTRLEFNSINILQNKSHSIDDTCITPDKTELISKEFVSNNIINSKITVDDCLQEEIQTKLDSTKVDHSKSSKSIEEIGASIKEYIDEVEEFIGKDAFTKEQIKDYATNDVHSVSKSIETNVGEFIENSCINSKTVIDVCFKDQTERKFNSPKNKVYSNNDSILSSKLINKTDGNLINKDKESVIVCSESKIQTSTRNESKRKRLKDNKISCSKSIETTDSNVEGVPNKNNINSKIELDVCTKEETRSKLELVKVEIDEYRAMGSNKSDVNVGVLVNECNIDSKIGINVCTEDETPILKSDNYEKSKDNTEMKTRKPINKTVANVGQFVEKDNINSKIVVEDCIRGKNKFNKSKRNKQKSKNENKENSNKQDKNSNRECSEKVQQSNVEDYSYNKHEINGKNDDCTEKQSKNHVKTKEKEGDTKLEINRLQLFIFYIDALLAAANEIGASVRLISILKNFSDILNNLNNEPELNYSLVQNDDFDLISVAVNDVVTEACRLKENDFLLDKMNATHDIDNLSKFFMNKTLYSSRIDNSKYKTLNQLDIFTAFIMTIRGYDALVDILYNLNEPFVSTEGLNMDNMHVLVNYVQACNKIKVPPLLERNLCKNLVHEELSLFAFSIECNHTIK